MNRAAPIGLAVAALALPAGAFAAKTPTPPKAGQVCKSTSAMDKKAHLKCVKGHLVTSKTVKTTKTKTKKK